VCFAAASTGLPSLCCRVSVLGNKRPCDRQFRVRVTAACPRMQTLGRIRAAGSVQWRLQATAANLGVARLQYCHLVLRLK